MRKNYFFPSIDNGIKMVPRIKDSSISRVEVLWRKALRIALGVLNSHPNTAIQAEAHIPNFQTRRLLQAAKFY